MEDAHISNIPFTDKKLGLFGVFDGHGGIQNLI
jgi:serine/threonine protein phosphatase PrpC